MTEARRNTIWIWLVGLLLLPVLYLASLGPACWCMSRTTDPAWIVPWALYIHPAAWLCDLSPWFGGSLEWYVGLWIE